MNAWPKKFESGDKTKSRLAQTVSSGRKIRRQMPCSSQNENTQSNTEVILPLMSRFRTTEFTPMTR